MYYTVIKHSGNLLRTLEKCRKHSPAARVLHISLVFSNVRRVLSQCNTRLRLLYLLKCFLIHSISLCFPIYSIPLFLLVHSVPLYLPVHPSTRSLEVSPSTPIVFPHPLDPCAFSHLLGPFVYPHPFDCGGAVRIEWSGFKPWPGTLLCSWARHLTRTVPLSTQEYKWVPPGQIVGKPNKLRGSDLRWTSIPSRGSRNIPSRIMLQKPG